MADRPAKPEGMGWLSPYIIVKDIKSSLEFYEKAFGFKTRLTIPDKEGNIMHAEVVHKDATIMMSPESEQAKSKSPATLGGSPTSFYLYVDDVDDFFIKAKAAGAKVHTEPVDQFWGDRMCNLECPEGHHWAFATNVADFDPSKAPK